MTVLAHRGGVGGTTIGENTLCAFKRAFKMRCANGIECDLRRVKSGEIVILHDAQFNKNGVHVNALTLDEIRDSHDVCTLTELLSLAQDCNYKGLLNLEIKEYDIAHDLCNEIKKYNSLKFMITSFLHPEVKDAHDYFDYLKSSLPAAAGRSASQPGTPVVPSIPLPSVPLVSFGLLYRCFPMSLFETLTNTDYNIVMSYDALPLQQKSTMSKLSYFGNRVFVYTVNEFSIIKSLLDMNIGVITDFPKLSGIRYNDTFDLFAL